MALDLFAGIPVSEYERAAAWYEQLFIEVLPEHAGHARHRLFVDDFEARLQGIADLGLGGASLTP